MNHVRFELRGLWAALPTPWSHDGRLDREVFQHDITRICRAAIHGVYSGGTTGEFYAQDFARFVEINECLVQTSHANGKPVQCGCTALSTRQAVERVRYARSIGADAIQIALPFWLELDDDETLQFFEDIASAAGDLPIIHYDTIRSKRRITPDHYARICERVPTLQGTKFGGADLHAIRQITLANPRLRVFTGEHILASGAPVGVTGSYSSVVLINPEWMADYYNACREANWPKAFACQEVVCKLFAAFPKCFQTPRLQDTAVDRIFGQLGGVLRCPLTGEKPYRHGTPDDLARLKEWAKKEIPELLGNKG